MTTLRIVPRSTLSLFVHGTIQRKGQGFATAKPPNSLFSALDTFSDRHIGPDNAEAAYMLSNLGYRSMDAFVDEAAELLRRAKLLGAENKPFKSYIGMGYHNAVVPPVILRNVMENPAWYTQYTPYQAELAQGRLESLVNFQTMIMSLTAMDIANSSLLTKLRQPQKPWKTFLVDNGVLPQTLAVLRTRAKGFGIRLVLGDASTALKDEKLRSDLCGVLLHYPDVDGHIKDFQCLTESVHAANALVAVATDLLALTMLNHPANGRKMPGRIIGRSRDVQGLPAYRLALQTREQHIRREKATSNICTSQALLANMAAMYAVYHGPEGLRRIANKVHGLTQLLKVIVERFGYRAIHQHFFDTLTLDVTGAVPSAQSLHLTVAKVGINLRIVDDKHVGITLDESVGPIDFMRIVNAFAASVGAPRITAEGLPAPEPTLAIQEPLKRTSEYLPHPVFNKHHSETEMLRYIHHLQSKDLSLVHSMTPLGSCTMKLNSTSSMIPLTWPEFGTVHPFAPSDQVKGYSKIINELEADLCKITGEYAGLSVIRAYHESRGEGHRDICLIPVSAHGTNPASAVMAGLKVVPVKSLQDGSLDLVDLKEKAEKHKDNLAALMITYPSTFGVFEDGVLDACQITHDSGGQVYLDGANLNAQIGLTNPATCGGDVCHMNLHKTFAIPHGGGGPGMGPICVAKHLAPFLPSHPVVATGGVQAIDAVSAAPWGSASILLISWAYIKMLGGQGLADSSKIALLSANYMAHRLAGHYSLRYKNANGRVAHELLIDFAEFDKSAGLKVTDFAKRLQDYGFHPPTVSWPISTCMLIEPTESESLEEIDRFCDAMINIRREVEEIITGKQPRDSNVLKNAPHPISVWNRPYSRQQAAYPLPWLRERKFWPAVSRVDDAYGDTNLICDCPSVEESAHDEA
ncbi:pyridoxal phosphate-dependent transferase [Multifurca ochricompacta]|uniref:Glycine cleavage system P protein n=1 Tax=Multifurca ochricompacta TaxID=376703 RepID=A0AAD4MGK2_9AGAM|nr:pyridoxal phosphate-dependent transferase [Multifurca ochricompacta]